MFVPVVYSIHVCYPSHRLVFPRSNTTHSENCCMNPTFTVRTHGTRTWVENIQITSLYCYLLQVCSKWISVQYLCARMSWLHIIIIIMHELHSLHVGSVQYVRYVRVRMWSSFLPPTENKVRAGIFWQRTSLLLLCMIKMNMYRHEHVEARNLLHSVAKTINVIRCDSLQ